MSKITIELEDEETGEEVSHDLPAKWEICHDCEGEGKSSAYLGAYTSEEFYGPDWDDEERERYLSGGYDRPCTTCSGTGKILQVDEEACNRSETLKPLFKEYERKQRLRAKWDREDAMTRRMESGGYDY